MHGESTGSAHTVKYPRAAAVDRANSRTTPAKSDVNDEEIQDPDLDRRGEGTRW